MSLSQHIGTLVLIRSVRAGCEDRADCIRTGRSGQSSTVGSSAERWASLRTTGRSTSSIAKLWNRLCRQLWRLAAAFNDRIQKVTQHLHEKMPVLLAPKLSPRTMNQLAVTKCCFKTAFDKLLLAMTAVHLMPLLKEHVEADRTTERLFFHLVADPFELLTNQVGAG